MKKILGSAAILILLSTAALQAQPNLDPSFSGTGYKLTKVDPLTVDVGQTVLVQPNGSILTGGNSIGSYGFSDIVITRVKTNGAYDNSFGTAGIRTIPGGFLCDMALTSTGKIIVAGSGVGPTNVNNFIVYRLTKKGAPDNTFGSGGSVAVNIPNSNMICNDVAIQADGKIVLAGYQQGPGQGKGDMLIVRLNRNGTLDNTFGTGGMYTLYLTGKHSICNQVAIQADGKIVAGGHIDTLTLFFSVWRYDMAALRLNKNGTPDNTFGSGGLVRLDNGSEELGNAIAILSDGRIVLSGSADSKFTSSCLLQDGSLDMSFGNNGWKTIDFYGGNAGCSAMAIEPDDDIILAGLSYNYTTTGSTKAVALAKMNSAGVLDNTFGTGGIDTSLVSLNLLGSNDVALQSDGKILVAGFWYNDGVHCSFFTARYSNSAMKEVRVIEAEQKMFLYPNPVEGNSFNINYELAQRSHVVLTVYDLNARILNVTDYGSIEPGSFTRTVVLPDNIPGGIYYVQLHLAGVISTQKIIVVR